MSAGEWVLVPRNPVTALPILHALSDAAGMERLPDPSEDGAYPITGQQSTVRQWYDAMLAAAPQPPAEAHCATCSCVPGMTPAVRFDTTPAEREGVVRDHLIRMGWTPPAEAQAQGGGEVDRWDVPPCIECGAVDAKDAETKCICAGDKDDCHGCHLWPDGDTAPPSAPVGAEVMDRAMDAYRAACAEWRDQRAISDGHAATIELLEALAQQPAAYPERIVLWSRGVSPNWYFIAKKADRPDIEGAPVYETLDEIILRGSPEAQQPAADEESAEQFRKGWQAGYAAGQQPAAEFRNDGNSEADYIAHHADACTACGGSGHKADQQPAADMYRCVECDDHYRVGTPCDCRVQPGHPDFTPVAQQPAAVDEALVLELRGHEVERLLRRYAAQHDKTSPRMAQMMELGARAVAALAAQPGSREAPSC